MRRLLGMNLSGLLMIAVVGCGQSAPPATPTAATQAATPAVDNSKFLLTAVPESAQDVIAARKGAKDGDDIVIEGRIGGDVNPWVDGRAAFQIVDRSLVPCNERSGDSCPTPWDYCCDTDQLPKSKATVKFVDAQGKTLTTDARQLLGIKELQ
ncbi:MAG: signal peptide-domain containing protein, partial [Planctomycetaceae bacterium]|nr:signal peptide-domain containing protein [Planctomycetaceae bacterium]